MEFKGVQEVALDCNGNSIGPMEFKEVLLNIQERLDIKVMRSCLDIKVL